jgi:hypothetical protein
MSIEKYNTAELDILIAEATKEQSLEAWIAVMMASMKKILGERPSRYRAYGPYWFPVKNEFIKKGDFSFGDFVDAAWLSEMDYGDIKYNMAAAFAYEETQFNLGLMEYSFHSLEDSDGTPIEYVSADTDMERV